MLTLKPRDAQSVMEDHRGVYSGPLLCLCIRKRRDSSTLMSEMWAGLQRERLNIQMSNAQPQCKSRALTPASAAVSPVTLTSSSGQTRESLKQLRTVCPFQLATSSFSTPTAYSQSICQALPSFTAKLSDSSACLWISATCECRWLTSGLEQSLNK